MKKITLLLIGMLLFLAACSDSAASEEEGSNQPKEENSDSQVEELDTNNEETTDKEEMSKRDALYYLEEITKNYLNISYHNVFDEETEQLISDGVENIDAAVSEIDNTFKLDEPLVTDVKNIAEYTKEISEDYLSKGEDVILIDASEEIGSLLGAISNTYLDGEMPPTVERVLSDFDTNKQENQQTNNVTSGTHLDTGMFVYDIKEIEQVTSVDGNTEILAIEMSFTNNTDHASAAWPLIGISAEQEDGNLVKDLSGANSDLPDDYKSEQASLWREKIKPGATVDVVISYEILYPGNPVRLYETFGAYGEELLFERIVETK